VLHQRLRSPVHARINQRVLGRQNELQQRQHRQPLSPLHPPLSPRHHLEEGSVWVEVIGQVSTRRVRCHVSSPTHTSPAASCADYSGTETVDLGQPLRMLSQALFGRSRHAAESGSD
jgi:hypothetical protein